MDACNRYETHLRLTPPTRPRLRLGSDRPLVFDALRSDTAPRDRLPDPTPEVHLDDIATEVHRRTGRRIVAPTLRPPVRLLLEAASMAVGGDHLLPAGSRVTALMRRPEPAATVVAVVELPLGAGLDQLAAAGRRGRCRFARPGRAVGASPCAPCHTSAMGTAESIGVETASSRPIPLRHAQPTRSLRIGGRNSRAEWTPTCVMKKAAREAPWRRRASRAVNASPRAPARTGVPPFPPQGGGVSQATLPPRGIQRPGSHRPR
jgi:hypothetical protein